MRRRHLVLAAALACAALAGPAGATTVTVGVGTWRQEAAFPHPSARTLPAMSAYGGSQHLVLFGGTAPGGGSLGDTWSWDGATWTLRATTGPAPRTGASLAPDRFGRLLLFGGVGTDPATGTSVAFADTWLWNGVTWTEVPIAHPPAGRGAAAMAYDEARGQVVLFGGTDGARFYDDTWTWDGLGWTQRTPGIVVPARYGASMAYDRTRARIVLYGGARDVTAGVTAPTPYTSLLRIRMETFDDTWVWDGSGWTYQVGTYRPTGRAFGGLAYDARAGGVVAFGGLALLDYEILTATTPTGHVAQLYSYQVIPADDTWLFTSSWDLRPTAGHPHARWLAAFATDPASGVPTLFGGSDGTGGALVFALLAGVPVSEQQLYTGAVFDDTWTLRTSTDVVV